MIVEVDKTYATLDENDLTDVVNAHRTHLIHPKLKAIL